jgi:hypothetical protein
MSEETVVAASSAPVEVEAVPEQRVSLDELNRQALARLNPAEPSESATDDQSDIAPDTDAGNDNQEQPQKGIIKKQRTADARIAELTASVEREWEKEEPDFRLIAQTESTIDKIKAGQKRKTEPAPVIQSEPPSPQPTQQYAYPKPTAEDANPDGTLKYGTYEDVVEAIGRWAAREERVSWERERAELDARKILQSKLEEARTRYDDVDVVFEVEQEITNARIPALVKDIFLKASPDVYIDLCYLMKNPIDRQKFLSLAQSDPRAAIGQIYDLEKEARNKQGVLRNDKGQFVPKEAPEPKKSGAPKPPSPVGSGGGRGAFDVNDESLPKGEWLAKRRAQTAQ